MAKKFLGHMPEFTPQDFELMCQRRHNTWELVVSDIIGEYFYENCVQHRMYREVIQHKEFKHMVYIVYHVRRFLWGSGITDEPQIIKVERAYLPRPKKMLKKYRSTAWLLGYCEHPKYLNQYYPIKEFWQHLTKWAAQ